MTAKPLYDTSKYQPSEITSQNIMISKYHHFVISYQNVINDKKYHTISASIIKNHT